MKHKAHAQLRQSQVVTTYGPGALMDLPRDAAIVGGLDFWPKPAALQEIVEPRLARKLQGIAEIPVARLYQPPVASDDPSEPNVGIVAWRFPEWGLVQERHRSGERGRSRRLVHRESLDDKHRFDNLPVVPIRFVRACPNGHVDDIDWHWFVHGESECPRHRQKWLDERGTTGDLADLTVRCDCGKTRSMVDATQREGQPLGRCFGKRPWLGKYADEDCKEHSRLLTRTASNSYFPQVVTVLSLPDRADALEGKVRELWDDLEFVKNPDHLQFVRQKPHPAAVLDGVSDDDVLAAIKAIKDGGAAERPVKLVELDALLAVPEGYGDDVPVDHNFHARRLPDHVWRKSSISDGIESVTQVHRLREVRALVGFTRFEAITPDITGEYDTDVTRAQIASEPAWFPAVENRGEGVFVALRPEAVREWLARSAVQNRADSLISGHKKWLANTKSSREFPGAPYVLLHTVVHLLIQSLSERAGYAASSIRERIYMDAATERFALLLYTSTADADGTLGGLVQQAVHIEAHLAHALRTSALCSNDPVCALHEPDDVLEERWLHGAACHGCTLIAEPSCEMRNDYLDRTLVAPTLAAPDAAFFPAVG